ncbi:hypothetical protein MASR1M46_18520 [Bacteroidales bacterium]
MLLEGMTIGAFAMGATKGVVYIRAEYPLAVRRLKSAIEQAKEYGLLGKNILNSGFSFDLDIVEGAELSFVERRQLLFTVLRVSREDHLHALHIRLKRVCTECLQILIMLRPGVIFRL